jgi:8-oxo-dGTP diphosphatase
VILLVRHALAEPRSKWRADDDDRPLTKRGERQSAGLPALLADRPVSQIVSSPAVRCTATVAPLATARGQQVVLDKRLKEGRGDEGLDLVVGAEDDVLLCTHGDVILGILADLRRLGWPVPKKPRNAKGSVWVLSPTEATYLPPP